VFKKLMNIMNKTKKLLDSFKESYCPNSGLTYFRSPGLKLIHPQQNLKQFVDVTSEGSCYYRYHCPWCKSFFFENELPKEHYNEQKNAE
jgi:hypothetical protein